MAAEGGVELANPTDASEAYPDLWPTRDAAKKAIERHLAAILGTNPYKILLIRECPQVRATDHPGMVRLDYQRAGRGQRPTLAWFDPALVSDLTVWLAERLGEMAWVRMEATDVATSPEVSAKAEAVPEVPGGYGDLHEAGQCRRGPRSADDPRDGAKRDRVPSRSDPPPHADIT
jgi:hypothetical protein